MCPHADPGAFLSLASTKRREPYFSLASARLSTKQLSLSRSPPEAPRIETPSRLERSFAVSQMPSKRARGGSRQQVANCNEVPDAVALPPKLPPFTPQGVAKTRGLHKDNEAILKTPAMKLSSLSPPTPPLPPRSPSCAPGVSLCTPSPARLPVRQPPESAGLSVRV